MKEEILIGTLLGDGSIGKLQGRSKSYKIKWEHCRKQEEYAIWKAEQSLESFSIYRRSRLDKRTGNTYHSTTIYSTVNDYKDLRFLFYPKGIKEVSEEVLSKLTPLSIAVWFMDDGNLYYNGNNCHLTLSVNGFSRESRERIIDFFKKEYDINFKLSGKAIRLTSVREVNKFENNFKSHYHNSMKYKTLEYGKRKHKQKIK